MHQVSAKGLSSLVRQRPIELMVDSIFFLVFSCFSLMHHRPNAAMLVPHKPRLVSDDLSGLFNEREGLSMFKSL